MEGNSRMPAIDLEWVTSSELEAAAARILDANVFGYYATGARDERTLLENIAAWDAWWLRPRRLSGIQGVSTRTTLLGREVAHPVIVGPSAGHRMATPAGELATARAVAALGGIMIASTSMNAPVEEIASVTGLDLWFQLYPLADTRRNDRMVRRAIDAGTRAIVLTVDVSCFADSHARPVGGFQDPGIGYPMYDDVHEGLRGMDWGYARGLMDTYGVPVVLKGILHPEDAVRAADEGFLAIVVSNHGGRTLDGAMPTALALPEVVEAAAGRLEVYVDSGIRRGSHVLKALALGARAALVVRPILWGLAVGGEDGARAVLAKIVRELAEDMEFSEVADVTDVPRDLVVPARPLPGPPWT
jgi:4-hydroxymandelate oxidase